jgi:hypothetical protein
MITKKNISINRALVCLVLVNCVPLFGVTLLGWKASEIILLYWTENIVVGFYCVLKMMFAKVPSPIVKEQLFSPITLFIFYFSVFTLIHGVFVLGFLLLDNPVDPKSSSGANMALPYLGLFFWVNVGLFFVSHGVSFISNYIIKGECYNVKPENVMNQPVKRLIVMNMTIVIGAYLGYLIELTLGVLLGLVIIKTGLDVVAHLQERRGMMKLKPKYGSPYKLDASGKVDWLKEQGALTNEEALSLKGKIGKVN